MSERDDAYEAVRAYWDRGTHVHEMTTPSADCGCPQDYRDAHRRFIRYDTDLHACYQNSGYHHMLSGGLWYAVYDDD